MEKRPMSLETALRLQEIEKKAEKFAERVWKRVKEEVDDGKQRTKRNK